MEQGGKSTISSQVKLAAFCAGRTLLEGHEKRRHNKAVITTPHGGRKLHHDRPGHVSPSIYGAVPFPIRLRRQDHLLGNCTEVASQSKIYPLLPILFCRPRQSLPIKGGESLALRGRRIVTYVEIDSVFSILFCHYSTVVVTFLMAGFFLFD